MATVDHLVTTLLGGTGLEHDGRVAALRADACAELTGAFTRSTPTTQLPAMMPALAHLFAWAIQLDVLPAEVGRLAASIREDHTDGANPRSRGELFLAAEGPLLSRVETARHDGVPVTGTDRAALLAAFDRAGVGREPLADETSSDLMIRSASTAGAVGATVLDSPASGLAAVRPVTRLVRGAMLVLHWTIVGLTSRGVIPRMLALLGLSVGGILLIASLFGALPDSWAGPAALIGWSSLLAAFAFGALRTGTLLHGLVLLSPIVPLLTYAFTGAGNSGATSATSAMQGGLTLVAMVGVAVGLLVLGSLPAAYGSVWLALGSLADRRGVVHEDTRGKGRLTRLTAGTSRRARGLLRSLPEVVKPLVIVALPALLAWWIVSVGVSTVAVWIVDQRLWLLAGAVVCLVVGAVAALYLGDLLRPAVADPAGGRHRPRVGLRAAGRLGRGERVVGVALRGGLLRRRVRRDLVRARGRLGALAGRARGHRAGARRGAHAGDAAARAPARHPLTGATRARAGPGPVAVRGARPGGGR